MLLFPLENDSIEHGQQTVGIVGLLEMGGVYLNSIYVVEKLSQGDRIG